MVLLLEWDDDDDVSVENSLSSMPSPVDPLLISLWVVSLSTIAITRGTSLVGFLASNATYIAMMII